MGIGGAMLSAVQLFTGLAAAGESARSQLPIEFARTFAFPPENLLTLAMPNIFGQLTGDLGYWGRWYLWEDSLFIGTTATILALYGAFCGDRKYRRFAVTFLVVSLLLALGNYTPVYGVLYRFLPGMSSFRGVSKFAYLSALFLANLAAVGLDRLLRANTDVPAVRKSSVLPAKPVTAIGSVAMIMAILAAGILFSANAGAKGWWGAVLSRIPWSDEGFQYGSFGHNALTAAFIRDSGHGVALSLCIAAGVCTLVAAMWQAAQKDRRWFYGVAAIAAVELFVFAANNQPTFDLAIVTNQEKMLRGFATLVGPEQRAITGMPTVYMMAGGFDGWGNDPMVLRRYSELISKGLDVGPDGAPIFSRMGPLWGLVRIQGALVQSRSGIDRQPFVGVKLARAQLIDSANVIADPKQMLEALANPKFTPGHKVLLEKPVSLMPTGSGADLSEPGVVQLSDLSTDAIEITADVSRNCILLISDNYSAGWHARSLDGAPAQKDYEVVRADYTLRGIPLTPGKHHLLLEYKPTAYIVGKYVTMISLLGYILAAFYFWRPKFVGARS
jgi:hypothetical protein